MATGLIHSQSRCSDGLKNLPGESLIQLGLLAAPRGSSGILLLLTQIEGRPKRPRLSQGDPTQPREDALRDPPLEPSPGRWPEREVALAARLIHGLIQAL